MKGVILAGGTGSRLFPLTRVTNKHLLPVGRKPMIMHCVEKLTEAGINEIMVITGPEHMGAIVNLLGSGKDFKCHFTYRVQDEAGGIAQALGLCASFVHQDHCCVILGDNIFTAPLTPYVSRFREVKEGAMILLKRVPDPGRYGVAELSSDKKKVVAIEEKPKTPKTDYAVTGMYFYDASVFNIVKTLKPSGRGELEITDVNNEYVRRGQLLWAELPGEWTDAGTFPSLLKANEIMAHADDVKGGGAQ
ncbi:MAG TPA: sugar phosphate nucleotidyltransferase [Planctomycetota bacterium]|nr:sugar phosphate nucleotidyltransferase [Planctomycetota bacterium]